MGFNSDGSKFKSWLIAITSQESLAEWLDLSEPQFHKMYKEDNIPMGSTEVLEML